MVSTRLSLLGGLCSIAVLTCRGDSAAQRQAEAAGPKVPHQSRTPPGWCAAQNAVIDPKFAITAARTSLGPWSKESDAKSQVVYVDQEGFLVRVRSNISVGGGGLAWVDAETGCVVQLRRYE